MIRASRGPATLATVAALVVALLVAGCSVTGHGPKYGPEDALPDTVVIQFDPSGDLPKPASNLVPLDDNLVAYLTVTKAHRLHLVAVNTNSRMVLWWYQAAVSLQPQGVALRLSGDARHRSVYLLASTSSAPIAATAPIQAWVMAVAPDGRSRWSTIVQAPTSAPEPCGRQVCIETRGGTTILDARTGRIVGRGAASGTGQQLIAGTGGDAVSVVRGPAAFAPAAALVGTTDQGRRTVWRRTPKELFGRADLTSDSGWSGRRFGPTWILQLGSSGRGPDAKTIRFPYREPPDAVAAVSADGTPRWHRRRSRTCRIARPASVVALCSGRITYPSRTADAVDRVATIEAVAPATGRSVATIHLAHPIDQFDPGGRVARLGPDRFAISDGDRVLDVDLRRGTTRVVRGRSLVGWCPVVSDPVRVRGPFGEVLPYARPDQDHPCAVGPTHLTRRQLLEAAASGRLRSTWGATAIRQGPWLLWVEHGRLAGVRTDL